MVQREGLYPINELIEHLVVFSNMADIDFYQEDSDDISDSCLEHSVGLDDDCYGPDDHLSPLQKLEKYMNCDNVFSRQMVAKSMLDTLRAVGGESEECDAVLKAMVRLSDDAEATVRSELMEQVPHVAMYCIENRHIFPNSVPTYILPMVVKYLNDMNNQVRKTSQAALLVVLEQELVEKQDIEEQVVGVISDLARPDSPDDFKTEAVALMSKLAPLLGREITESQFLSRFCEMCTDNFFHVRKVCAANFGEICTVVSPESVEDQLLPKFYFLCEDGVWGVRKACAECFMVVSRSCTSETRRSQLSTIFVNLLCDMSRWVRVAAFQALGPFISTYADPRIMELLIQEGITSMEGEITYDINSDPVRCGEAGQGDNDTSEQTFPGPDHSSPLTSGGERTEGIREDDMELDAICDTNNENIITISDVTTDSSNTDSELSVEEKRFELYKQNNDNSSSKIEDVQNSDLNNKEESSKSEAILEVISQDAIQSDQEGDSQDNTGESPLSVSSSNICDIQKAESCNLVKVDVSNKTDDEKDHDSSVPQPGNNTVTIESTKEGTDHIGLHQENVADYNAFQFWRTPIPAVNNEDLTNIHTTAKDNDEEHQNVDATETNVSVSNQNNSGEHVGSSGEHGQSSHSSVSRLEFNKEFTMSLPSGVSHFPGGGHKTEITLHTASVSTISDTSETLSNISSYMVGHTMKSLSLSDPSLQDHVSSNLGYMDSDSISSTGSSMRDSNMFEDSVLSQQQDVIPPHLLEQYLSMADPTRAQTVDSEITRHCAYSLPAVAFTLGRKNWPCLKILYETLAADMQWKVRRTLAFSIHELALIVGEDITHEDLVPVFNGFLKDLDEVREGVLKHLADFLRLLQPDVRRGYLPRVQDFLTTDNQKNWRFRMELAEQLVYLCELFTGHEICEHLIPIGMSLVGDRVAAVRQISCKLLAVMMRHLSLDEDERMVNLLVNEITQRFAQSNKWHGRQLYAQLCLALLEENSLSPSDFATLLLPSLLELTADNIPNVRISLAKTLSRTVIPSDYFTSYQNPHHDELLRSIQSLKSDLDKDVRYFSSLTFDLTDDYTDDIPV